MRRISLLFLVLFCFNFSVFCQIDSVSVQGINCYNDTGYVKLNLSPGVFVIESDEWEYQPYDSTSWLPIDSNSFLSLNYDTLHTTTCGKYRVTLFDSNTGLVPDTVIFFVPCAVTIGLGQEEKIKCFGDSSGVLTAPTFGGIVFDPDSSTYDSLLVYFPNDTTGDEYYNYEWYVGPNDTSTLNWTLIGDSTNVLNNVYSRFYNIVVTDAIGCKDTLGWEFVNNPYPLLIDSFNRKDISCYQGQDGNVNVVVNGGRKFHSSRNYNYYIVDFNNDTISRSDELVVSQNFNQLAALSDSSLVIDSISFNNLAAGTYTVIIEDSFGCIIDTFFTLFEPQPYEAFVSEIIPIQCISDSGLFFIDSIAGGNGLEHYYWLESNNMSDSNWCFELSTGNGYNIVILDTVFQCSDTIFIDTIQADFEIKISNTIVNALCYNTPSGTINIDSTWGGNIPYTYIWGGNIGTNMLADSLFAGSYFLQIEDSIGCSQFFDFNVEQNDPISVNSILSSPSCNGLSDGVIQVNVSGGESPYSLSWSNVTSFSDSLFGLSSGIYILNIVDDNLCEFITTFVLNEPDSLALSFNNFTTPLLCYGGLTPISAIVSGGTGPFSFSWSNNSTNSQTVLGAGIWSCDLTDNNGCLISENIIITQPDEFFISDSSSNNPLCSDGGSASIQTSGGTTPISYLWSTGEITQSVSNIMSNSCWVIATDSCGNTDSVGFNLMPYDLVTSVNYNDTNHLSQVIVDSISSGSSFGYEWFFIYDSTNIVATGAEVYNLCEGTYVIRTSDLSNGCFSEDTLIVNWYLLSDIVNLEITTVLPDSNLWGFGPYTYLWGPTSGFATQKANICPGDHWVEVSDRDGCKIDTFFTIDDITVNLDPANELIECDLENLDIELSVSPSGGTDPYTYSWANGSTDSTINLGLSPGKLAITIMDNNGCILDTVFRIAAMTSECVPNVFTPNNDQVNDIWNLEQAFLYTNSEITIWGRYGNKVYESIGYDDPWDGKNESGNDAPDGVYFYHIELGNGYDPIQGTVTILR
ncbi:MAG: hypothetical protein CMD09_04225 [Flavobacteriales bacterium]|nr:hypothetical protein [Flavobacteriales bacterium]OUW94282.1 MAG: hypothetical protein CBD88_05800 [Flavobacteriales bacterium TMED228]|tara:strand:- start:231 stop:3317 length:3087 start_codon:yes stop_codon:yes gene_type:complete